MLIFDKFEDKIETYKVKTLEQGDMFGEISMILNCKNTATVRT